MTWWRRPTTAPEPNVGTLPVGGASDPIALQVRDALRSAAGLVEESPDLWARIERSIDAQDERRRFRRRVATALAGVLAALLVIVYTTTERREGKLLMRWWLLELLVTVLLAALAAVLGPFIKRFGKSYAGDVFRANPRTGKSYIMLTDIAYYLIFSAYILFTLTFERPIDWGPDAGAAQLKHEVARVGGILLIIGLLHAANIVMLPMMGRLLSLNRQLDDGAPTPSSTLDRSTALGSGEWVLRIERVGGDREKPTS